MVGMNSEQPCAATSMEADALPISRQSMMSLPLNSAAKNAEP